MIDEGTDPTFHRWQSFARLLMYDHPRIGAERYAIDLGNTVYREGWNVIHPSHGSDKGLRFTLVSADGGLHTRDKPDVPDDELNHVYEDDTPQLVETRAWSSMVELGEVLSRRNHPELLDDTILAIQRNIQVASQAPLRGDAKMIENMITDAVSHIQGVLARGSVSGGELVAPALLAVRSYMKFERDGNHAANVLSWILGYLSIKFPSPLSSSTDADRTLSCADHLRDLTFTLLSERNSKKLGSFCDMTYLALLYGNTGLILYDKLLDSSTIRPEHKEAIEWRRIALDEEMAHEASPSLVNPSWYCPIGVAELITASAVSEPSTFYPGARKALERGETDPAKRWNSVAEYSASAQTVSIVESLEEKYCPLAPAVKQHLMGFLVTYEMGRRFKKF